MFDSKRGHDRGLGDLNDRSSWSILGCHQWAPTPEHPSHTWTYMCPGHNAVVGQTPLKVTYRRSGSRNWIQTHTIAWECRAAPDTATGALRPVMCCMWTVMSNFTTSSFQATTGSIQPEILHQAALMTAASGNAV